MRFKIERPAKWPMDRFHKTHLVIGLGEVGRALLEVLSSRYTCEGVDKGGKTNLKKFDVLHVCYPHHPQFLETTVKYKNKYLADKGLTIIHSTVPVGTSKEVNAVHSPIRGVHPNLSKGIRTFCKYFGGEKAVDASEYFLDLGMQCKITDKSETTEALKLWDTTQYGLTIVLMRSIHKWCQENNVDFEVVYTHANSTYNQGYTELNMSHVNRPVLKPMMGRIGGHCVIPNAKILDSDISDIVLEADATY
jgi:hypothetical protein